MRSSSLDESLRARVQIHARCERPLLGERSRHDLIAGHGDVDDPLVVGEESILTKHADARVFCNRDRAVAERLVAREHFEKRRLARSVRADEPVARAGRELERHVRKERARAERFLYAIDADQVVVFLNASMVASASCS